MTMDLVVGVVWLAVGGYLIVSGRRWRGYVNSLPPTKGNKSIRREQNAFRLFGVGAVAVGVWHIVGYFR
jgi:hypothetical protein